MFCQAWPLRPTDPDFAIKKAFFYDENPFLSIEGSLYSNICHTTF